MGWVSALTPVVRLGDGCWDVEIAKTGEEIFEGKGEVERGMLFTKAEPHEPVHLRRDIDGMEVKGVQKPIGHARWPA